MEDGARQVVDVDGDEEDVEESESDDGRYTGWEDTLREDEVLEEFVGTDCNVSTGVNLFLSCRFYIKHIAVLFLLT